MSQASKLVKVTYSGCVGVRSLSLNTTGIFDVLKSLVHPTAIAASVPITPGAVNELLLTEGYQLSQLDIQLSFQRTSLEKKIHTLGNLVQTPYYKHWTHNRQRLGFVLSIEDIWLS